MHFLCDYECSLGHPEIKEHLKNRKQDTNVSNSNCINSCILYTHVSKQFGKTTIVKYRKHGCFISVLLLFYQNNTPRSN